MKTATLDGKIFKVEYKTHSGMRTKASYNGRTFSQGLSCDVYDLENGTHKALVLNSVNGDINRSVTVITNEEYSEIAALHDPYSAGEYHTALLEACGAVNHLQLS